MASFSGTSVRGMQTLISGVTSSSGYFAILLPAFPALPPRRVGYFYVSVVFPGGSEFPYVIESGHVSTPSRYLLFDVSRKGGDGSLKVDVNWNEPGIDYSGFI
jgi:hypothetical protein